MLPGLALGLLLAAIPYGPDADKALQPAPAEESAEEAADPRAAFLAWSDRLSARQSARFPVRHPEPAYRFAAEAYGQIAALVRSKPGVVRPFRAGSTVQGRPIWGFTVARPDRPARHRVLVFAGIHALEWISVEVATSLLQTLAAHPPDGVEVVVLPVLNLDGRMRVEKDFLDGEVRYRRSNAAGVDLNRDFAINQEATAFWEKIVPKYYHHSKVALSQPESQAIDRLGAQGFDVTVSLHAFGGFIYYPWSGRWPRPEDYKGFELLGDVMAAGQGAHAYRVKQLSHWGFFFRAQGSELDHLYGKYGSYSYLIELTRSGIQPLAPSTWQDPFRFYNPVDPKPHIENGVGALRELAFYLSDHDPPPRVREGPPPVPRGGAGDAAP